MSLRSITQFHGYTGVVATYGDLLNVTGSPNQNAYLKQGDQAYVTSEKVWYICDVDTLGAAVWVSTAGSGMRRSYGDTHIAFPNRPFPMVVGNNPNELMWVMDVSGGNRHFITDFKPYALCQCRVKIYDSGNTFISQTDTQFADHSAIAAWVTANVPNDGVSFTHFATMEVFDIIDNALVPPAKVYGHNKLWTVLTTRKYQHRYWSVNGDTSSFNVQGQNVIDNVIGPVFKQLVIDMLPGLPTGFDPSSQKSWGTVWFSPIYRSRYDMPGFRPESCLVNSGNGNRWAMDNSGSFSLAASNKDFRYDTNAAEPYYLALDSSGTNAIHFSASEGLKGSGSSNRGRLGQALIQGYSVVLVYPLVDPDAKNRSFYIKPVGIEQIYFSQFDGAQYRIEAVGTHRHDKRPRLLPLKIDKFDPRTRSAGPVAVFSFARQLMCQQWGSSTPAGSHSHTSGQARFQYRDLVTGRVSPLTSATLSTVARKRGRPVSWLIKNSSDY